MLVVDVKKRIGWEELFSHQINFYQEEKIKNDLEATLKGDDVMRNMSKFYINNNKVKYSS
jgi:serine/threonine-protein kinase ULK/ATG1